MRSRWKELGPGVWAVALTVHGAAKSPQDIQGGLSWGGAGLEWLRFGTTCLGLARGTSSVRDLNYRDHVALIQPGTRPNPGLWNPVNPLPRRL